VCCWRRWGDVNILDKDKVVLMGSGGDFVFWAVFLLVKMRVIHLSRNPPSFRVFSLPCSRQIRWRDEFSTNI
jgi:hypothetical protein